MAKYARIVNQVVREVLDIIGDPATQFHPDIVAQLRTATPEVVEGYFTPDDGVTWQSKKPATLAEAKQAKRKELREEFISRVVVLYPTLKDMDEIKLVRDQFLSVAPAARAPTTDFQKLIDTYQVAQDALTAINALGDVASVEAYDVVNTPAWPA